MTIGYWLVSLSLGSLLETGVTQNSVIMCYVVIFPNITTWYIIISLNQDAKVCYYHVCDRNALNNG